MSKPSILTNPGTTFGGGIYAGRFFIGGQAYALVLAPKGEGELDKTPWNSAMKRITGAESYCDGLANTEAMVKAGSALAKWTRGLTIGGHADWYVPSRLELFVAYGELGAGKHVERAWHWSSTQYAGLAAYAWYQSFDFGFQHLSHKGHQGRARAVRRIKI